MSVLLLDRAQMEAMHLSEGVPQEHHDGRHHVSCDVGVLDVEVLGRTLRAQYYALPLPYLSLDGVSPVGFERVHTWPPSPLIPRLGQRDMWRAIASTLRTRLQDLLGESDAEEMVARIRAGAFSRKGGAAGSDDHGQRLYEAVRAGIMEAMALRDPDGSLAFGTKGLARPAGPAEAWSATQLLGPQLA